MIVEYIRYALTDHKPDDLVAAYATASTHLKNAPQCLAFELSQCSPDSTQFVLRIEWASTEAHMEQFRRGPDFPPFLALVRPFVPEIAEMRHYEKTGIEWQRPQTP